MNSLADSSFQGILYRPNIEEKLNFEKKFMRKRKQIFQSLNLKKPHQTNPVEQNQTKLFAVFQNNRKSQKLQFPNTYLYSKPKHQLIIPIEQTNKIVDEISKSLNFVNKKVAVLNFNLLSILHEDTKSIPYESEIYKKELQVINMIFGDCGILLKSRDVMMLEGEKSRSKYVLFTSHPKHPQSLCCHSEVIIKHIDFLSAKNLKFLKEKSFQTPLKSLITLSCIKCNNEIIKIRPSENLSKSLEYALNQFQEQKRLMNYSKLISSGRFKKALINDESVELMKSKKFPSLGRSKTSLSKLQEISQSEKLYHNRYGKSDRKTRIKSYQESMNLKTKSRESQIQEMIKKRKNNISEIFSRIHE